MGADVIDAIRQIDKTRSGSSRRSRKMSETQPKQEHETEVDALAQAAVGEAVESAVRDQTGVAPDEPMFVNVAAYGLKREMIVRLENVSRQISVINHQIAGLEASKTDLLREMSMINHALEAYEK